MNTFNPFPYKLKIWENRIWFEQGRDTDFNITWNVLVSRIHWIFTKTSNFEIKISQKKLQRLIEFSIIWAWIYSHVTDSTLKFNANQVFEKSSVQKITFNNGKIAS